MKRKYKALLSLLLSVIIVFSAFPIPALADSSSTFNKIYIGWVNSYDGTLYSSTYDSQPLAVSGTIRYGNQAVPIYALNQFKFGSLSDSNLISVSQESTVTVSAVINFNFVKYSDILSYSTLANTESGAIKFSNVSCEKSGSNYNLKISYNNVPAGKYYFTVLIKCPYYGDASASGPAKFLIQSVNVSVGSSSSAFFKDIQEKLKGWFNDLFSWLKNIADGISNGFSNVGSWLTNLNSSIKGYFNSLSTSIKGFFSELSTNIKGFFSDLTNSVKSLFSNLTTKLIDFNNNIKTWFKNLGDDLSTWFTNLVDNIKDFLKKVGEWFTTLFEKLGNWFSDLFAKLKQWFENVGQWFKDLWNNITNKVTEIRTDLHNWWGSLFTPEDGFFEAYKTSFDEFFKQHFGILYQVVDFFKSLFSQMTLMLDGGGSGVIEYGELALPAKLFGKKIVILNSGKFSFDNLINSDDSGQLINISGMIYTVTSVIIYLALLLRAKKIFEQIITNGEGVED